jgi:periplasmic copper chaperone A
MRALGLLLWFAAMLFAPLAQAHDYKLGALVIHHPWSKEPPPAAPVAGGYMTIINTGTEPDRLIGIAATFAETAEIHEMKMDGEVMTMAELPAGLEIAPGAKVMLAPGGYHLMFFGLKQPPKLGDKIKATLSFEKAGKIEVEFKVEPRNFKPDDAAEAAGGAEHDHSKM